MRPVLFALIFTCVPFLTHAQIFNNGLVTTQPALSMNPTYPEPGEEVTVKIDNFYTAGNASVAWFYKNEELVSARNNQQVTITLDDNTSPVEVTAVINSANFGERVLTRTIRPIYIDIIFEPQTHVPRFYEGRALPSAGSVVNSTVLLFGEGLPNSDSLFYTWKVSNKNVPNGVGRGKNKISFEATKSWETTVSVAVTNSNGATIASKAVSVPNLKPELLFYEVSPLYGVIEKPLSSFNLIANSATIVAEPYFLDSRVYNNPDVATWNVDGAEARGEGSPYEMTFERVGFDGVATLGFTVRSLSALLQLASEEIRINY